MKHLFTLFFVFISLLSIGQSIKVLDSVAMQSINPEEVEYINISVEDDLVIENKSSILVDMSVLDVSTHVDSVHVELYKENSSRLFEISSPKPFLIEDLDSSVNVSIMMFADGDTLKFKSSNSQAVTLKVDRRERPTFASDTIVFGILALVLGFIFYTSSIQKKSWQKFYMFVPALLLCYLIPAVLDSLGLI